MATTDPLSDDAIRELLALEAKACSDTNYSATAHGLFTGAARNAVRPLAEEVLRLRGERENLRKHHDDMRRILCSHWDCAESPLGLKELLDETLHHIADKRDVEIQRLRGELAYAAKVRKPHQCAVFRYVEPMPSMNTAKVCAECGKPLVDPAAPS